MRKNSKSYEKKIVYLPSPSAGDTAPHQIAEKGKKIINISSDKKNHGINPTSSLYSIQLLFLPCSPENKNP
jgi:hypothetical protein